jgi:short-subunit dehydrogenase
MADPLAVVTGASGGIGQALAHEFARHGFDLLLSGRERVPTLEAAETVIADLATPDGVEQLYARVHRRDVTVLALNAGISARSDDLERELALVDLNVRGTVHLARLVTADMAARGRGRVLLTASIVDTMPGPYQAAYNASKAFIESFGLGLRAELRDRGVSVTVLEPGPTETAIFARAGQRDTLLGSTVPKDDPADVARQAFEALMAGRERVVTASLASKASHLAARFIPNAVTSRLTALLTRPGGGPRS